jgi:endonuclease VIII
MQTAKRWALLYSASDIEVLPADAVPAHPYIAKLGPDTLDGAVTTAMVEARTLSAPFRRRQFATRLLDQGFLGGIGNYLRTEILYMTYIHPAQRPVHYSPSKIAALAAAALAAQLKARGYRRRDYRHWTFGGMGQPCHRCGEAIAKLMMGGRRCYICPQCQPLVIDRPSKRIDGV